MESRSRPAPDPHDLHDLHDPHDPHDPHDLHDLHDRMERNLAEHACHLHRHLPGATVLAADDLLIADSGLDDDTFNIVAMTRFAPDTAGARVAETVRTLGATGRHFSWWTGPASAPSDLSGRLAAAGPAASERETAMWAGLRACVISPAGRASPGTHARGVAERP